MSVLLGLVKLLRPFFWLVLHFFSKFRERISFEKSYRDRILNPEKVDFVFHVSSEGEIELVMPLLEKALNDQKDVLILFTSQSAVTKIEKLKSQYSENLSVSLLRLCYFNPFYNPLFSLPKTNYFFMVRYDFFFELLSYAKNMANKRILIAATMKGKRAIGLFKIKYWSFVLSHFDQIICSTKRDDEFIGTLLVGKNIQIDHFEYRIPRIMNRSRDASNLKRSPWFEQFEKEVSLYPREKRLILGSCWEIDLDLFKDPHFQKEISAGEWFIFLAPHLLDSSYCQLLYDKLKSLGITVEILKKDSEIFPSGHIVLSEVPGVLCELYQYFGHSYIGGGFGRSVHSILEPFFFSESIYHGPKVSRSTEVDLALEIDQGSLVQLEFPHEFYSKIKNISSSNLVKRTEYGEKCSNLMESKFNDLF